MRYSPHSKLSEINIAGLDPESWIIVEPGVSREEIKAYYLSQGLGFTGDAIQEISGFCTQILGPLVDKTKILSTPTRQEVLRHLLTKNETLKDLPEMRRLKRQRGFYKKLDRSVQSARLTYTSLQEREAQEERLRAAGHFSVLRQELLQVIEVYESWLQEHSAWDPPRLYLASIAVLSQNELEVYLPESIVAIGLAQGESRIEAFWDALKSRVSVERIYLAQTDPANAETSEVTAPVRHHIWHTTDDVCDALSEQLNLKTDVILMPDDPVIRRSLNRALAERGIEKQDPRDPTRLQWEESLKLAFLPLELVARRFKQKDVISFLMSDWVRLEITEKRKLTQVLMDVGIREGLNGLEIEVLKPLTQVLKVLQGRLNARLKVEEVISAHAQCLSENPGIPPWLKDFLEQTWQKFESDLKLIGESYRKAPLLFWLERFRQRLENATPPFERIQWDGGAEIYRLNQASLRTPERLWCVLPPARFTSTEMAGDYFYSDREREILSATFAVHSGLQQSQKRREILKRWVTQAQEIIFLDAHYLPDGKERESIEPLLSELGIQLKADAENKGAYPRWLKSYGPVNSAPSRKIELKPWGTKKIRATDLERFSRCEFQGLALGRWRLRDIKPSDVEIRADARGTLLHSAVQILMESWKTEGSFKVLPKEALEQAWDKTPPRGLFKSKRLKTYTIKKLLPILESFCESEREYSQLSGAKIKSLEGPELKLPVAGVEVYGIPDRIDEHIDGLIVFDYKTSKSVPQADVMLKHGYRLQLPVYALAAAKHFNRPPLAIQFVELHRDFARGKGLVFKPWHGKEQGSITQTRARGTVLKLDPSEVWPVLESHIETHVKKFISGNIDVTPKVTKPSDPTYECKVCFVRDVCGQRRFEEPEPGEISNDDS